MKKIETFDARCWIPRGSSKFLGYVGPPLKKSLDEVELKRFLKWHGALGATWSYDDDYADSGCWYKTVCDREDYDVAIIGSKNSRKKVNKCLKNCELRPIDIESFLDEVYNVYLQACTRYRNANVIAEKEFCQDIRGKHQRGNYKMFGISYGGRLIAYMTVMDFGEYAMGDIAGFDPAYSNYYPMYGLYYYVGKHFVAESGYKEFDRGSKPLLHETNVDDFLTKLEYRKKYCRLGVYFTLPVRIMLRLAGMLRFVYRWVIPKRFSAILDGLLVAQDIAKVTYSSSGVSE